MQDTACPWISQAVRASCPGNSDQSPGWEGQQNPCHHSLSSLQTVDAMDIMLKAVVLKSGEVLQDVLEVWPVQRVGVWALFLTLGGLPTPGWMVLSPVVSRQSTLQGGRCPALGLSWSTGAAESGTCLATRLARGLCPRHRNLLRLSSR